MPRPSAAGDVVVAVQRALVAGTRGGGGSFDGVVLVGGPDIVPMLRLDTLSPDLRPTFGGRVLDREDDFFVWSDDLYGDLDGDGFPEVAVSRVPDGRTPRLDTRRDEPGGPRAPASSASST